MISSKGIEETVQEVREAIFEARYGDLPPEIKRKVRVIYEAVSEPRYLALPKAELNRLVQNAFTQIGLDVECYNAPGTMAVQLEGRGPISLIVRNKGNDEITELDLNVDIAYVPTLGLTGSQIFPREIHLNSSLISNYAKLVDILEQDDFKVSRIIGNSASDATYGFMFSHDG